MNCHTDENECYRPIKDESSNDLKKRRFKNLMQARWQEFGATRKKQMLRVHVQILITYRTSLMHISPGSRLDSTPESRQSKNDVVTIMSSMSAVLVFKPAVLFCSLYSVLSYLLDHSEQFGRCTFSPWLELRTVVNQWRTLVYLECSLIERYKCAVTLLSLALIFLSSSA